MSHSKSYSRSRSLILRPESVGVSLQSPTFFYRWVAVRVPQNIRMPHHILGVGFWHEFCCFCCSYCQGWLDIYRRCISLIYIGYFRYTRFLWSFLFFNVTHCDYVLMSTVRVFCWLMTCALSIFSVLDNFCQIAPLHSNAVWMTRVLHLICKAHTHILVFGSKFNILAVYVQMLDICWKYR